MIAYRKVQPNFRKLATTDFVERYNKLPDPLEEKDLKILTEVAKTYKDAY